MADPEMFTDDEARRLKRGDIVIVRGKRYGLCAGCRQIVRLDKPLLGSLHICAPANSHPYDNEGGRQGG